MSKRDNSEKEGFRLWTEFLRRSKNYKAFCLWKSNREKFAPDFALDQPFTFPVTDYYSLSLTQQIFGDIHHPAYSFERWWKDFKKQPGKIDEMAELIYKPILSGPELIGNFDLWVSFFILDQEGKKNIRRPSVDDVRARWLADDKGSCIMKVNIAGHSPQELRRQFNKLIVRNKREAAFKEAGRDMKRYSKLSTKYIRLDELKRHLRVYDQFEAGRKWKEIAERDPYYKNHSASPETTKRLIYMDREKAERIIKNAEEGIFPGDYEKSESKN